MQHSFECAVLDNPGCVPWEVKYASHSFNPVADEIYLPCYENNKGNDCATAACIIEANFLSNIFKAFFQMGQRPLAQFVHKNGFDQDQKCPYSPMKASWSAGDKECCGTHPDRFPFMSENGLRGCCGDMTYNSGIMECCSDNEVKAVC